MNCLSCYCAITELLSCYNVCLKAFCTRSLFDTTNAALNDVADRLTLLRGGPERVEGLWPLVVANIRAGELMALAPALTRRVASGGSLVLSGIPQAAADEVEQSYRRLGMTTAVVTERDGWVALALRPSW